jgi:hypothetical protein
MIAVERLHLYEDIMPAGDGQPINARRPFTRL